MARWRLKAKHYLSVEDNVWEYTELDEATRRQKRKQFPVPRHLDPEYKGDHNYPGEIIVGYAEYDRDLVFTGPPTPDMEPLDDDARAISERESKNWINPIDSLSSNYSASLLSTFEEQLKSVMQSAGIAKGVSVSENQVSKDEFEALKTQMQELMAAHAALLAEKTESGARRI